MFPPALFLAILLAGLGTGCILNGGRKLARRPDPPRTESTYLSSYWYSFSWYIRHHYRDRMAEEYLNQPETLWHTWNYGRNESFANTFFFSLLSLDEEGSRCLAHWHSEDLSAGPITIDCAMLRRGGRAPRWTAVRHHERSVVRIFEFWDSSPLRTTYYYEVVGRIVAMDAFGITSSSPNWSRPTQDGRARRISDLMAEDAALQDREVLVYRNAVLQGPLPSAVERAIEAEGLRP